MMPFIHWPSIFSPMVPSPSAIVPLQCLFFISCQFPICCLSWPKTEASHIHYTFSLILFSIFSVGDQSKNVQNSGQTLRGMLVHNPGSSAAGTKTLRKLGSLRLKMFCSFIIWQDIPLPTTLVLDLLQSFSCQIKFLLGYPAAAWSGPIEGHHTCVQGSESRNIINHRNNLLSRMKNYLKSQQTVLALQRDYLPWKVVLHSAALNGLKHPLGEQSGKQNQKRIFIQR